MDLRILDAKYVRRSSREDGETRYDEDMNPIDNNRLVVDVEYLDGQDVVHSTQFDFPVSITDDAALAALQALGQEIEAGRARESAVLAHVGSLFPVTPE